MGFSHREALIPRFRDPKIILACAFASAVASSFRRQTTAARVSSRFWIRQPFQPYALGSVSLPQALPLTGGEAVASTGITVPRASGGCKRKKYVPPSKKFRPIFTQHPSERSPLFLHRCLDRLQPRLQVARFTYQSPPFGLEIPPGRTHAGETFQDEFDFPCHFYFPLCRTYNNIGGMIYFIQETEPPFRIKVGYSKTPWKRVKRLASTLPQRIKLLKVKEGEREDEKFLHLKLAEYRVGGTREWFYPAAAALDILDDDGTLDAQVA